MEKFPLLPGARPKPERPEGQSSSTSSPFGKLGVFWWGNGVAHEIAGEKTYLCWCQLLYPELAVVLCLVLRPERANC